jgi:uncharacterized protein YndB with AHSA1/START domain
MARPANPAAGKSDGDLVLTITRVFDASPAALFRAWTDAAEIGRWIGPRSVKAEARSMEARPGGRYEIAMHHESGKISTVRGSYREVKPAERLVFTWAWDDEAGKPGPETLVTITFRALGKQTEMTLRHERLPSKEARDSHNTGWTGSFDKLAEALAGKPGRA